MRFKVKPDDLYEDYYHLYFKCGWWPFWRKAGFMMSHKVEERMASLRQHERYL